MIAEAPLATPCSAPGEGADPRPRPHRRREPGSAARSVAPAAADRSVAIRTVVALAHALAAGVEQGSARARIRSRTGRWLVVHGFPLRGGDDAESNTAVVIEPAKASEIAPIIVEAYDLCPREQEITQLIARGLATAQIAQRLHLSPYTVRDYVKSVFEKVGVSSRGELVARVFAERYLEPLGDAIVHAPRDAE